MDNAVRYSADGGTTTIRVKTCTEGVIVSVKDSGPGIPEQELPFIWERFYKVDKSRTRQKSGTGLGLAIVKKIIELHEGRVWAQNSPGGGTEFSFFLPWKI